MINTSQQAVLHLLAYQCLWNGKTENAETLYGFLFSHSPDDPLLRKGLACAQLANQKASEALKTLSTLVSQSDPVVHMLLARALNMIGETAMASEAIERFSRTRPAWRGPVLIESFKDQKVKKGVTQNA